MLPEIIKLPLYAGGYHVYDRNNRYVLHVAMDDSNDIDDEKAAVYIAKCINACEGIADPETVIRWMKSIKVGENGLPDLSALIKENERLTQQVQVLAEALESTAKLLQDALPNGLPYAQAGTTENKQTGKDVSY